MANAANCCGAPMLRGLARDGLARVEVIQYENSSGANIITVRNQFVEQDKCCCLIHSCINVAMHNIGCSLG